MGHTIYLIDYDGKTGAVSNKRPFATTPCDRGLPDGMTVDANLVSSVAFGGEGLTDICCTTIGGDNKEEHGPGAGALFRLRLGIRGVPEFFPRIGL